MKYTKPRRRLARAVVNYLEKECGSGGGLTSIRLLAEDEKRNLGTHEHRRLMEKLAEAYRLAKTDLQISLLNHPRHLKRLLVHSIGVIQERIKSTDINGLTNDDLLHYSGRAGSGHLTEEEREEFYTHLETAMEIMQEMP